LYKHKITYSLSIINNSNCRECAASKSIPDGIWQENENWCRKCPTCNKTIKYTGNQGKDKAKYNNKQLYDCKRCSALKRPPKTQEVKNKISKSLIGHKHPKEVILKIISSRKKLLDNPEYRKKLSILTSGKNNGMYGKHHSTETRKIISDKLKISMNSPLVKNKLEKIRKSMEYKKLRSKVMTGRIFSDEHRRKLRLANIKRISEIKFNGGQLIPGFNPNACKLIDEYGKQHGYNFQHALNGGEYYIKELGYWVDGYDKENNVVIETDEKHHFDFYGNLREKDVNRQKEITEYLKCKFIRLNNMEKI
jgi:hypothetical protein